MPRHKPTLLQSINMERISDEPMVSFSSTNPSIPEHEPILIESMNINLITNEPAESFPSTSQSTGFSYETPKKRKFVEPRYISEAFTPDVATPKRARRVIHMAKETVKKKDLKIKALRARNYRLVKKIKNLRELVDHLRKKDLMSEGSADYLMNSMPENLKELLCRKLNTSNRLRKYTPKLRAFALTIQFYSNRAYKYIRKTWSNLLPHPATIRKWYCAIDGRPGFTQEAFKAMKMRQKENIINIVIDEMAIRQQIVFDNKKFHGYVDLGTELNFDCDHTVQSNSVLVFMAVAFNSSWKVPLGYFFINSLTGRERANLLLRCFELLRDNDVKVFSITFDGAAVNFAMCNTLGASFDFFNNFKPYIVNPFTKSKVFIFLDPCHMIKLIRNTLGDKKVLFDGDGRAIKWSYIEKLVEIQNFEGLHCANKIRAKHVKYNDNRMNVRLAVQTLSESVCKSLLFMNNLGNDDFNSSEGTANYCLIFNHSFDLLNCRNKFSMRSNKFRTPISDKSYEFLKQSAENFVSYIIKLTDANGVNILNTNRKTGFLGLIVCLRNIFELFKVLKNVGLTYLLSFKISQDYLETFFSCIRSRGGFNNNPNCMQFQSAYKRLLLRHEINAYENMNCLADGIDMLHYSSKKSNFVDSIMDDDNVCVDSFDHDYISTAWSLSPYLENIIDYISGS